MKIPASAGVIVGDSWRNDVMGAAGVSMDSVWLHKASKKQTSVRKVGNAKVVIVRKFSQLSELFGVFG
jgi:putative hydrolase of the HAD superfamily